MFFICEKFVTWVVKDHAVENDESDHKNYSLKVEEGKKFFWFIVSLRPMKLHQMSKLGIYPKTTTNHWTVLNDENNISIDFTFCKPTNYYTQNPNQWNDQVHFFQILLLLFEVFLFFYV